MSTPRKSLFSNWREAQGEIDYIHRLLTQLQGRGKSSTTTLILTGSGGGSGTSTSSDNIRVSTDTVTANTLKTVNFAKALTTKPTFLIALIIYTSPTTNGWTFPYIDSSTITTTGFQIAANEILYDGTLTYFASIAS
jgi:hypothetical protein